MKMPRALIVAYVGFGLIGAATIGAFVYERGRSHPPAGALQTLKPAPVGGLPEHRPDLHLAGLDGQSHALSEWDGHPLLVNFWATWCAPCRREIPLLNTLAREHAKDGLKIVGIAIDFAADVKTFVQRVPIEYPLLTGEEEGLEAARAFGVDSLALPFTVFIDRKGRILTLHLGELHPEQADALLKILARVDRDELSPEDARRAIDALPVPVAAAP